MGLPEQEEASLGYCQHRLLTNSNFIQLSTSLFTERLYLHYSFKLLTLTCTCRPTTDDLHRLLKITLFQTYLCIFTGNSVDKYTRETTCALYRIYRLAINQLNFTNPVCMSWSSNNHIYIAITFVGLCPS